MSIQEDKGVRILTVYYRRTDNWDSMSLTEISKKILDLHVHNL